MIVNAQFQSVAKAKSSSISLFVLVVHCLVAVHVAAYEYAIELHSAGNEERVGLARILVSETQGVRNPVTGAMFQGTQHAIDSIFDGTASVAPDILQRLVTPDFFQQSLFDHIWKIYTQGHRGLQRSIKIRERYLARIHDYSLTQRIRKTEGYIFKKTRVYTKTFNSKVRQQIADIFFDDHQEPSSTVTAFQEWLINELGYKGQEVVSFDSYLRQVAPYTRYWWQGMELPYHRNRWVGAMIILTPFAHNMFKSTPLLDTGFSKDMGSEGNYFFPMDWQQAFRSQGEATVVSRLISGEALYLYEYREGSIKKKEEPLHLQRYDFIPLDGSVQLVIWGLPGEFEPWGWEYKEKIPPLRAVRYLRILPVDNGRVTESQAARVPVKSKRKVTYNPSLPSSALPKIPEEPVNSQTVSSEIAETTFANTAFLFIPLVLELIHFRTVFLRNKTPAQ